MSTIPSRVKNINEVLENINNQTLKPNKIFLNIPSSYKRFKKEVILENDLDHIIKENVEIIRCKDYGPGTKIMGSIHKVRNYDCVILIDDDHIMIKIYVKYLFKLFKRNR